MQLEPDGSGRAFPRAPIHTEPENQTPECRDQEEDLGGPGGLAKRSPESRGIAGIAAESEAALELELNRLSGNFFTRLYLLALSNPALGDHGDSVAIPRDSGDCGDPLRLPVALCYSVHRDGTGFSRTTRQTWSPGGSGILAALCPIAGQHLSPSSLRCGRRSASRLHRGWFASHRRAHWILHRNCAGAEFLAFFGALRGPVPDRTVGLAFHDPGTRSRAHQPDGSRAQRVRDGERARVHAGDRAD